MKARNEPSGSAKDGECSAMSRLLTATAKWGKCLRADTKRPEKPACPGDNTKGDDAAESTQIITAQQFGSRVKFSFQVSSHSTSPMSLREPVRQKKLLERALEWLEWGTGTRGT